MDLSPGGDVILRQKGLGLVKMCHLPKIQRQKWRQEVD